MCPDLREHSMESLLNYLLTYPDYEWWDSSRCHIKDKPLSNKQQNYFKFKVCDLHCQSVHIDVGGEVKNYFHPQLLQ